MIHSCKNIKRNVVLHLTDIVKHSMMNIAHDLMLMFDDPYALCVRYSLLRQTLRLWFLPRHVVVEFN
jgi:hypothetical protein